jgi:hypothetical protein
VMAAVRRRVFRARKGRQTGTLGSYAKSPRPTL